MLDLLFTPGETHLPGWLADQAFQSPAPFNWQALLYLSSNSFSSKSLFSLLHITLQPAHSYPHLLILASSSCSEETDPFSRHPDCVRTRFSRSKAIQDGASAAKFFLTLHIFSIFSNWKLYWCDFTDVTKITMITLVVLMALAALTTIMAMMTMMVYGHDDHQDHDDYEDHLLLTKTWWN